METTNERTGVTVMLPRDQRAWLVREAANRAAQNGSRVSVSELVRELVDRARRSGDRDESATR